MKSHRLTVTAVCTHGTAAELEAECSCGEYVVQNETAVTLDRISELMDMHVQIADEVGR